MRKILMLGLMALICAGCNEWIADRHVIVHPSATGTQSADVSKALKIIDDVAAQNSFQPQPKPYVDTDPRLVAHYWKYGKNLSHPIVVLWVYLDDGTLSVKIRDAAESGAHYRMTVQLQKAFYDALVNSFGASRVEMKKAWVKLEMNLAESETQTILLALKH